MAKNKNLYNAKRRQNDEFYTQLSDIENELRHYKAHFKDKVVYCNCDDPRVSNFFYYFSYNFKHLGLKRLISSCYKNQERDLFSKHDVEQAIMLEYDGFREGYNTPNVEDIGIRHLQGDGDFRSAESIELLKQADVVVTNPPFSLFREYVDQLMIYDKKFLVLGNMNAITYKEIFPLIKNNRIWLGHGFSNGIAYFKVRDVKYYENKSYFDKSTGLVKFGNVGWYTNLDHAKRHEELILFKRYSSEDYPIYDNYDAIEVSKTKDIPKDYEGVMGVPITFLDKYNPDQFELLGATESEGKGFSNGLWFPESGVAQPVVRDKRIYKRLFIRNKRPQS